MNPEVFNQLALEAKAEMAEKALQQVEGMAPKLKGMMR